MHQNSINLVSLGAIRERDTAGNLAVVLLFGFLNPLYAISICAVLNFMNLRINFRLFSVMFAASFGLFYFLRDWRIGYDAIYFLRVYQMADSLSLLDIFYQFVREPKGHEPFWYIYLWLFRTIFGDHVELFAFSNLCIIFLLAAYLGKVVNEQRFVVIILCILFVHLGFLYNVYEVWRHTLAMLTFFIGIFLFEADKHRRLARGLIYSSALFHLVAFPLAASYEFFNICGKLNARSQKNIRSQRIKRYSIQIVAYAIFAAVIFKLAERYGLDMLSSRYVGNLILIDTTQKQTGYQYLFNPLSYVLIFYFWFNQKQMSKNDIFIGINYFVVILALSILDLPSSPLGRALYFFLFGASILSGKLILSDLRLGSICLFTIIFYTFTILGRPGEIRGLSWLLGGDFLNPAYGLVEMIFYYGTFHF